MTSCAPSITLRGRHMIGGAPLFSADITLTGGRWTCILGRSGVGKSTLLRLIAGLDGAGQFDGQVTASDGIPIAGRTNFMAQDDLLLPWLSVLENTVLGARLRGDQPDIPRAQALLERVGLARHMAKTPAELSGGMRPRTALARTLMESRPLAFLDEPFSALDASTRADMQDLTSEMLRGKTVLLVTHDPAEAMRLGHAVIVLTPQGASYWPMPDGLPPRDSYAPDVVAGQAGLMAHLRGMS